MKTINQIEDIQPMTIVRMLHGKFAIVEAHCNANCVVDLDENEEWQYDPHHFMKKEWEHVNYGIGNSIVEAFEDLKTRYPLPGFKIYKCTNCQEINIKKDNKEITVGKCKKCEHPLWND